MQHGSHPPGPQGPPQPGWWLASDGNWYPPTQQSGQLPPPPPPFQQQQLGPPQSPADDPTRSASSRKKNDPPEWVQALVGFVVLVVIAGVLYAVFSGSGDAATDEAEASASAQVACRHLRNVVRDISDGLLTEVEARQKFKEVHDDAVLAEEVGIGAAAKDLLAASTAGLPPEQQAAAAQELLNRCGTIGA